MLKDMSNSHNTAIIVAAGKGTRFGGNTPKQFLKLDGREILDYSVRTFQSNANIESVIIVSAREHMKRIQLLYPECKIVAGGTIRQISVLNGLAAVMEKTDNVLVHDAARPLVSHTIIDACLHTLSSCDGVAPGITPFDSMLLLEGSDVKNLPRENLRIVQTPQCFPTEVLRQALASGLTDTDELGLVRQAIPNARLCLVEGSRSNMKITGPEDLIFLESLLHADKA